MAQLHELSIAYLARKSALVIGIASLSAFAPTQVVSYYSHSGTVSGSTYSDQYVYAPSGGGRGSHNYSWQPRLRQQSSFSVTIPENGSTGYQSVVANYYLPAQESWVVASTELKNGTNQFFYRGSFQYGYYFEPQLPAHANVFLSSGLTDSLEFTCPGPTLVRFTSSPGNGVSYSIEPTSSNGDPVFSGGGGSNFSTVLDAGSYVLKVGTGAQGLMDSQTGGEYGLGIIKIRATYALTLSPGNN